MLQLGVSDLPGLLAAEATELDAEGRPRHPLVIVDLDEPGQLELEHVAALAEATAQRLALTVGVSRGAPSETLAPLVEALTVTLTDQESGGIESVQVRDIDEAVSDLESSMGRTPLAAISFGILLRQTSSLSVWEALAAESAAYSMLLAGEEFRAWVSRHERPEPPEHAPEVVHVRRVGNVLSVELSRPDRRNAYGRQMRDELVEALDVAIADVTIERVELSGDGPVFCSGGDLGEFATTPDVTRAHLIRLSRNAGWRLHRLGHRATVAVHGRCVGAGVEIPAFAGRVTADVNSTFRLPEVSMGLIPGAGGCVSVTRRIGRWRTAWLGLTGTELSATKALEWGLVDELSDRLRPSR